MLEQHNRETCLRSGDDNREIGGNMIACNYEFVSIYLLHRLRDGLGEETGVQCDTGGGKLENPCHVRSGSDENTPNGIKYVSVRYGAGRPSAIKPRAFADSAKL